MWLEFWPQIAWSAHVLHCCLHSYSGNFLLCSLSVCVSLSLVHHALKLGWLVAVINDIDTKKCININTELHNQTDTLSQYSEQKSREAVVDTEPGEEKIRSKRRESTSSNNVQAFRESIFPAVFFPLSPSMSHTSTQHQLKTKLFLLSDWFSFLFVCPGIFKCRR